MKEFLLFKHPEPEREGPRARPRIHPVFLPFAGCPHRCLFCDQSAQTGQAVRALEDVHRDLAAELSRLVQAQAPPRELAFYGGTFTALPEPWPRRFLELAAEFRIKRLVTRVRCSTRPDAVSVRGLRELARLGLDMVELGVQSFDDQALAASGRGYAGETARQGCEAVREAGLALGVQLLPGLPGDRPGLFRRDCEVAARLRPETARLYPCMVLEGTRLATLWRAGEYAPWSLARARQELALGLGTLWRAEVSVIRIGLASEPGLDQRILAGPEHPSLGQMVRSLALHDHIRVMALRFAAQVGRPPRELRYPRRCSGEISGFGGELAPAFGRMGFDKVGGWDRELFFLQ